MERLCFCSMECLVLQMPGFVMEDSFQLRLFSLTKDFKCGWATLEGLITAEGILL